MIIVEIPVHPLSARIVETTYAVGYNEPIKLPSRDLMFQHLCYRNPRPRSNVKRLKIILTNKVSFLLNKQFAKTIAGESYQIGYHLFSFHTHQLLHHVHSQVMVGIPAMSAIANFRALYGITEDDFSMEASYKRWQRFEWQAEKNDKNTFFSGKNIRPIVLQNCHRINSYIPPTPKELDAKIVAFAFQHIDLFQNKASDWRLLLFRQFCIYIHYMIGKRKVNSLVKQFSIPARTIYNSIGVVREYYESNFQFALLIDEFFPNHPQLKK